MKFPTHPVTPASIPDAALEACLDKVEQELTSLGAALHSRSAIDIDTHASALHRALASAIDHFSQAARSGPLPPALRSRLVSASAQVAAQRESLARATAALDRAIDVLIPCEAPAVYSAYGSGQRGLRSASLQA